MYTSSVQNTVEPPVATTSRKQPPLLSDQFSKIPHISKSFFKSFPTTSRKRP